MSPVSKRHIFDLIGPAIATSAAKGPIERHKLYSNELSTALREFEQMIMQQQIVEAAIRLLVNERDGYDTSKQYEDFLNLVESVTGPVYHHS